MNSRLKPDIGAEFMDDIIVECHSDAEFRRKLVSDPVCTINQFTGKKLVLPVGFKLKIVDQTQQDKLYINLPNKDFVENLALTEEQLDQVTGGFFGLDDAAILTIVVVGTALYHINDFIVGLTEGFTDDI